MTRRVVTHQTPCAEDVHVDASVFPGRSHVRCPGLLGLPRRPPPPPRDAFEGKGPQRRPQKQLGRRLEEVAEAVGGDHCRLQMPLKLALGVRETVTGRRVGALGGGGGYLPSFQCIPPPYPSPPQPPYSPGFTVDDLAVLLCRMECNNFSVWDDVLFAYAAAVFPVGALANHSCTPACVILYDAGTRTQELHCLRDVAAGDEITHAYIDIACPAAQRRQQLAERYYFRCECAHCASPLAIDALFGAARDGTVHDPQAAGAEMQTAQRLHARGVSYQYGPAESRDMLAKAHAAYRRHLHPRNLSLMSLTCHYLNLCLEAQDWETAYGLCADVVASYAAVYPPNHPMIGLQYCTLADVADMLRRPECFGRHLREAHRLLTISHGTQNPLVQSIAERLRQERLLGPDD